MAKARRGDDFKTLKITEKNEKEPKRWYTYKLANKLKRLRAQLMGPALCSRK